VLIAIWALASYYSVSSVVGALTIHDDGSLTQADRASISRLFPSARVLSQIDLRQKAEQTFGAQAHTLAFFMTKRWQARKLIDPYLSSERSRILLIDSDVLWFKDPPFLKDTGTWMMSNAPWFCRMPFLDDTFLDDQRSLLNSGIVYFSKESFNLVTLEDYLVKTGAKIHHFLEQAGYACALTGPKALPTALYAIKGVSESDAILRHYTGPSRAKLFFRGIPYLLSHSLAHVRH
jgi:hypothetical protein